MEDTEQDGIVVGIDLGTTNSIISTFINGEIVMIPNQYGEYTTPSVVSINAEGEVLVGKIAKERLITSPNSTTSLFKRHMGANTKILLGSQDHRSNRWPALAL